MKPFLIYTFSFDMGTGGIKVMHKLCHLLNEMGYTAHLFPIGGAHARETFETYPKYNTPLMPTRNFSRDYIVIYPEIIDYNPLHSNRVVRWMLGNPGYHSTTYANNDLIFWYGNLYKKEEIGQFDNNLLVFELHEDIFYDKKLPRSGTCHTLRKNKENKIILNSELIPFYDAGSTESKNQLAELGDLFNKKETFISYDDHTFLSIFARMSGCISIVEPNPEITREQWLDSSPLVKNGIAYGWDDIQRATETVPLFYKELSNAKRQMMLEVVNFAEKCQSRFKF